MHQGAVLVLTAFQCCDMNNVRQTRLSALTMHQPFAAQQQPTAHHYYPHLTQAHFQVPSCSGTIVFSGTTVFCTNQSEQADLKFRDSRAIKLWQGKPPPFFGGPRSCARELPQMALVVSEFLGAAPEHFPKPKFFCSSPWSSLRDGQPKFWT